MINGKIKEYFDRVLLNQFIELEPEIILQPERLSEKTCDCSGINIMHYLDENSKKCSKCGSIFTRCDSLSTIEI